MSTLTLISVIGLRELSTDDHFVVLATGRDLQPFAFAKTLDCSTGVEGNKSRRDDSELIEPPSNVIMIDIIFRKNDSPLALGCLQNYVFARQVAPLSRLGR